MFKPPLGKLLVKAMLAYTNFISDLPSIPMLVSWYNKITIFAHQKFVLPQYNTIIVHGNGTHRSYNVIYTTIEEP